jgi:uncharacterized membrane protein
MSTALLSRNLGVEAIADVSLKAAVWLWFLVAMIGQWAFLYYILAFYGRSTFSGNFQAWSKNTFLQKGYIAGDTSGNLAFAAHALLAAIIAFGGALQLVPQIRTRAISLHRWMGRIFFVTAFGLSASGLYVLWFHGAPPNPIHGLAISVNAVLIIAFIVLAWRSVRKREISIHRRWALRTYLAANAQWFTRVGIMVWLIASRKLLAFGGRFDGAFFLLWDFGCYLVPLAILELYLYANRRAGPSGRFAVAGGLIVLTLVMGVGIVDFYSFTQPLLDAMKGK